MLDVVNLQAWLLRAGRTGEQYAESTPWRLAGMVRGIGTATALEEQVVAGAPARRT